jgi:hypothetical protein
MINNRRQTKSVTGGNGSKTSGASLTSKEKKQVKEAVLSIMGNNVEHKWNTQYSSGVITTAWNFVDLTAGITQGDAVNQRSGNVVHMKKFRLHFDMVCGDATNLIRLVIFKWKPNSLSDTPTVGELIQDTTSGYTAMLSPTFVTRPNRAVIVFDKTWNLDTSGSNVHRLELINLELNYNVGFNTGANTGVDHLHIGYACDSGIVPNPVVSFGALINYTDS